MGVGFEADWAGKWEVRREDRVGDKNERIVKKAWKSAASSNKRVVITGLIENFAEFFST